MGINKLQEIRDSIRKAADGIAKRRGYMTFDEWEENEHPRKEDGKFAPKGSGNAAKKGEMSGKGEAEKLNLHSPDKQIAEYPSLEGYALWKYTESSGINRLLAEYGYENLNQEEKGQIQYMDAAIKKSGWNEDTIYEKPKFYRGGGAYMVGVPSWATFDTPKELEYYINQKLIGTKTTNVGYTSITGKTSVAKDFAEMNGEKNDTIILEYMKIGKGVRGAYVSNANPPPEPISEFKEHEDETILQRDITTIPLKAWVADDGRVHVAVAISA